jgi:hypothetical protein
MKPNLILRAEGLALLLVSLAAYSINQPGWGIFALLFLAPDLGILGYLGGPKAGAWAYNALHTTILPLMWGLWIWKSGHPADFWMPALWLSHIGFDRLMGYGLKHGDDFKHTHLQAD